jgi:hypothetical protein
MAKKKTAPSSVPAESRPKSTAPVRRRTPATAPARARKKAAPGAADAAPTPEQIAEAAYHRYLNRSGQGGTEFDDWVEAERELREKRSR